MSDEPTDSGWFTTVAIDSGLLLFIFASVFLAVFVAERLIGLIYFTEIDDLGDRWTLASFTFDSLWNSAFGSSTSASGISWGKEAIELDFRLGGSGGEFHQKYDIVSTAAIGTTCGLLAVFAYLWGPQASRERR